MKNYELTYLISSEISETETQQLQAQVVSLIQTEGGIILEEKMPFGRKLAYPVKKQSQAYLSCLVFQLEPEKLKDLEKKLKEINQILRYLLLVKYPAKKQKATAFAKKPKPLKTEKEKKVDIKEIEKKLDEILENEPE
ncbi:MAG: 30S ribosomal protein S6 [Candidatus Pacebacteria bacterium]|nr:30S ribosomal protein S6 [Candidatus Paceibacterota bacterium]